MTLNLCTEMVTISSREPPSLSIRETIIKRHTLPSVLDLFAVGRRILQLNQGLQLD